MIKIRVGILAAFFDKWEARFPGELVVLRWYD